MDIIKLFARRSLFRIILFTGFLCILIHSIFYFAMNIVSEKLLFLFVIHNKFKVTELEPFIRQIHTDIAALKSCFVPCSTGILFLSGFILWLMLNRSFVKLMEKSYLVSKKKPEKPDKKPEPERKDQKLNDSRLFLHLISVLQREGRLLDFFSENLDEYEDEQIGGAVRSIHENCKKTINKYIGYGALLDKEEGDNFTVQPDFDPAAIKLTGNVTGEPPFQGIVRHKGWKATRLELPTLAGTRDPDIIAPAEVEILKSEK
jgi:hypothetical protein